MTLPLRALQYRTRSGFRGCSRSEVKPSHSRSSAPAAASPAYRPVHSDHSPSAAATVHWPYSSPATNDPHRNPMLVRRKILLSHFMARSMPSRRRSCRLTRRATNRRGREYSGNHAQRTFRQTPVYHRCSIFLHLVSPTPPGSATKPGRSEISRWRETVSSPLPHSVVREGRARVLAGCGKQDFRSLLHHSRLS